MKKHTILFIALVSAIAFAGCAGDHGVGNGQDTEQNTYKVTTDNAKGDTSYIITHTGDSETGDYSASGGAQLVKPDTTQKK